MRPIDTIRKNIDSDLTKYKNFTVCKILSKKDVVDVPGAGLYAMVSPMKKAFTYSDEKGPTEDNTYPVMIINRPPSWMDENMHLKFVVYTLNGVPDSAGFGIGLLVPAHQANDIQAFKDLKAAIPGKNSSNAIRSTKEVNMMTD